MAWKIEFTKKADKALEKMDGATRKRIVQFLRDRIAKASNPRSLGESLTGNELGNYWKYRVGDYRIICTIQDEKITVQVIKIGNRRDVYKDFS
ncbi:MAG: type II toxin-antitoxin system RelE family toxin [Candidatus Methylumidiphilus sp.]